MKYFKLDKQSKAELNRRIKDNHERDAAQRVSPGPKRDAEFDPIKNQKYQRIKMSR